MKGACVFWLASLPIGPPCMPVYKNTLLPHHVQLIEFQILKTTIAYLKTLSLPNEAEKSDGSSLIHIVPASSCETLSVNWSIPGILITPWPASTSFSSLDLKLHNIECNQYGVFRHPCKGFHDLYVKSKDGSDSAMYGSALTAVCLLHVN